MIPIFNVRDPRQHERLRLAGLVLTPVAALLLVRTFAPVATPRAAGASMDVVVQPFVPPSGSALSPAQAELARVIDDQLARGFGPSPLSQRASEDAAPVLVQDSRANSVPAVTLTSVLTGPSGTLAVLGGKLCSVGTTIEPGWTLEAIDASGGRVTLLHVSGRRHDLSIRPPGGK